MTFDPDLERRLHRIAEPPEQPVPQSLYRLASEVMVRDTSAARRSRFQVRSQGGRRFAAVVGIAAALLLVAVAGFGLIALRQNTVTGSPSPSLASPSSSTSPSGPATPSGSPAPSVSPRPTGTFAPPAAGAEWGGLTWAPPVTPDLPWGHPPGDLVAWQGRQIGIDFVSRAGPLLGDVVVAGSTDLVHWATLAAGPGSGLPVGGGLPWLVAGPTQLVALGFTQSAACPSDPINAPMECLTGISTSADGANWKPVTDFAAFHGLSVYAVVGGPKGLVAVGSSGWEKPVIWYSATGSSWQRVDLPDSTFAGAHLGQVAAVPGGFVATGSTGGTNHSGDVAFLGDWGERAGAWWSPDGKTWTRASVELPKAGGVDLGRVYATSKGMVAVGWNSRGDHPVAEAWSSSDGRSWHMLTIASEQSSYATNQAVPFDGFNPCFGDGVRLVFVAPATGVGDLAEIWESMDGAAWHKLMAGGSTDDLADLSASSGTSFVGPVFVTQDGLIGFGTVGGGATQPVVVRASAESPGALPTPTPLTPPTGGIARSAAIAIVAAGPESPTPQELASATAQAVYGDAFSALVGSRWIWQVTYVDAHGTTVWYDIEYYSGEVLDKGARS